MSDNYTWKDWEIKKNNWKLKGDQYKLREELKEELKDNKNNMKKILDWLVYSSANPEKFSRTVKAGLVALSPTILFLLAYFFGLEISQENMLLQIGNIVEFLGALLAVFFAGAKVFNTFTSWKK